MEYKNLPDLKALATLRAVVELGGVNQAAKQLNIGQPAVTKRLRSLEQTYNTKLFKKDGRKLGLTNSGQRVYTFTCLTLDHQELLSQELTSLKEGENLLRLEVTSAIGEHLLPELLIGFNDFYPQYKIESRMGYSRKIQTRLATGLTDIALLELAPEHPDIEVQKWREDKLLLVCSPKHPLFGKKEINLNQLIHYEYVLREPKSSIRNMLDKHLEQEGIHQLPTSFDVGSNDTIIEILGRGRHLSFLPHFSVKKALSKKLLWHINIRDFQIEMTLWVALNKANLNHSISEAFLQQINTYK